MMADVQIEVPQEAIAAFCKQNHIRRLALFGSVLRADFGPESDVDVLVEFEEGHVPGFFNFIRMEDELGDLLGRKVDLNTPGFISSYYRDRVMRQAAVQYAAA